MSAFDINKMEGEEENKTPDKKQIEAEEKEVMLQTESEAVETPAELNADTDGPVKAALSGDVTEQGREVKPKFIPIGAIKMPGFFTRNSAEKEKAKENEASNEKDGDEKEEGRPKRNRLQFLHTCPFTQFMHHPRGENEMSAFDINKMEGEEENKTPDKKQIEAEEKEVMLKTESEAVETPAELNADTDGPVKAALSGDVTEQGREVKPKFIPIGAIKMPGFFTRNSAEKEKAKENEASNEKDGDEKEEGRPKRNRLQFLHTCPFTQFMHHPRGENEDGNVERKRRINFNNLNLKYPKIFQRPSAKDPEAALASMETLEDKIDTPNDGMENVKLDAVDGGEGKVATKLPLKERIRQRKFIIDDIIVVCLAVLVLLVVIIGIAIGARAGPPAERPLRLGKYMTTLTTCGPVEGVRDEGVYKFYSIPYAVPPVGERRFTYAQPLNDISLCWNDTLPAHSPGPLCMQFLDNGTVVGEEDCLTLDVVTPHVRYDAPLPVVVLLGASSLAGGLSPAVPSAMYARTKEVVFVRPNFRLGILGFLALDALAASRYPPAAGNYALSDVLVALRWVQHNARHFGGDAGAVTVLAHRAGASLAAALLAAPAAPRLLARAWLSEPAPAPPSAPQPLDQAYTRFERFQQTIKCEDVTCLRSKSALEILTATPDVWLAGAELPQEGEARHSWLVLDGELLRHTYNESWAARGLKERDLRPVVLGTTQHAGHSAPLRARHVQWRTADVEAAVNNSALRPLSPAVWKLLKSDYAGLAELLGAVRSLCPLRAWARALRAPLYVAQAVGPAALAPTGADIQAILGTFESEGAEQRRFMAAMQGMFYYFVWHGSLPAPDAELLAAGQDVLPLPPPPLCRLLEEHGLVSKYARLD